MIYTTRCNPFLVELGMVTMALGFHHSPRGDPVGRISTEIANHSSQWYAEAEKINPQTHSTQSLAVKTGMPFLWRWNEWWEHFGGCLTPTSEPRICRGLGDSRTLQQQTAQRSVACFPYPWPPICRQVLRNFLTLRTQQCPTRFRNSPTLKQQFAEMSCVIPQSLGNNVLYRGVAQLPEIETSCTEGLRNSQSLTNNLQSDVMLRNSQSSGHDSCILNKESAGRSLVNPQSLVLFVVNLRRKPRWIPFWNRIPVLPEPETEMSGLPFWLVWVTLW